LRLHYGLVNLKRTVSITQPCLRVAKRYLVPAIFFDHVKVKVSPFLALVTIETCYYLRRCEHFNLSVTVSVCAVVGVVVSTDVTVAESASGVMVSSTGGG